MSLCVRYSGNGFRKIIFFENINVYPPLLNLKKKNEILKKKLEKLIFFYKIKFFQINISILFILNRKMKKVVLFFIVWIFLNLEKRNVLFFFA